MVRLDHHDRIRRPAQFLGTSDPSLRPTAAGNGPIAAGDSRARQFMLTLPDGRGGYRQDPVFGHDRRLQPGLRIQHVRPRRHRARRNPTTPRAYRQPRPWRSIPTSRSRPGRHTLHPASSPGASHDRLERREIGNAPVAGFRGSRRDHEHHHRRRRWGPRMSPTIPPPTGNGPIAAGQALRGRSPSRYPRARPARARSSSRSRPMITTRSSSGTRPAPAGLAPPRATTSRARP